MAVSNYEELRQHIGHKLVCVCYADQKQDDNPEDVAIECETCGEVLLDFEQE